MDENRLCNIFLSYQWKSQPNVKKLYAELESLEGINVFMDIYKIKAGMNLYSSLASNIQQADVILACVSREYVKSKNCEREIIYADAFNKPIIPLYIEKIPIPELGSIGFVLVRERYCSLYRNQNIFDNLAESDEFKDILDGIYSSIKTKAIPVSIPFNKKILPVKLDDNNISQAVVNFRNDKPIEELLITKSIDDSQVSKNQEVKRISTAAPSRRIYSAAPSRIKEPFNLLEIHPVIKSLNFLINPNVLLEPIGDRLCFMNKENLKRGDEPYYPPVGWVRYGLKISLVYKNNMKWLSKDGNKDEWAVVYTGFKNNPLKTELSQKLIDPDTGKFRPQLKKSNNTDFANSKDTNQRSDGFKQPCGLGILCSSRAENAEIKTYTFTLNGMKYKMLLQCRANPIKIRIPQSNSYLRIVNSSEHIRPYGILIKETL